MVLDMTGTNMSQENVHDECLNDELSGKIQQWTYDNICQAIEDRALFRLSEEEFILVKIEDKPIGRDIFQRLYQLQLMGYVPILAGVEKNSFLMSQLGVIEQLMHRGVLIHVDACSIIGKNGRHAQKNALNLCKKRYVHLVTMPKGERSDPVIRKVDEMIRRKTSGKYVMLLKENKKNIKSQKSFHVPKCKNNNWFTSIQKKFARLGGLFKR